MMKSGVIGFLLGVTVSLAAFWSHDSKDHADAKLAKAQLDSALARRASAVETVTVVARLATAAKTESDRLSELVGIVGPTTLTVKVTPQSVPQLVEVPPEVVAKMRADSLTIVRQARQIVALELLMVADSVVIGRQNVRIRTLERKQFCGAKCGAAIATGVIGVLAWIVGNVVPN